MICVLTVRLRTRKTIAVYQDRNGQYHVISGKMKWKDIFPFHRKIKELKDRGVPVIVRA